MNGKSQMTAHEGPEEAARHIEQDTLRPDREFMLKLATLLSWTKDFPTEHGDYIVHVSYMGDRYEIWTYDGSDECRTSWECGPWARRTVHPIRR